MAELLSLHNKTIVIVGLDPTIWGDFMGKIIKSSFKKLIAKLFQILGISSLMTAFGCGNIPMTVAYGTAPVDMYGTPPNYSTRNEYTITGSIIDKNSKPIQGIKVSVKTDEEAESSLDDFYSDTNGYYFLRWWDSINNDTRFQIIVEDEDGEENGSFDNKTFYIEFTDDNKIYDRKYNIAGINIILDEKSDTESNEE